jgi:WD40 repeat protein
LAGDTGYAAMAVFSADGAVLATMNFDQVIRLWDVKTGKQLHSFPGHTAPVALLAFSAEGQTLTSVGENHVICQWDATGKLLHQFDRRESGERPLAFTRDLKLLVARPQVQEPRLVDVKTGKTVRQLGIDVDGNILLSPDERWLVEGLDSIRTWDLEGRSWCGRRAARQSPGFARPAFHRMGLRWRPFRMGPFSFGSPPRERRFAGSRFGVHYRVWRSHPTVRQSPLPAKSFTSSTAPAAS